MNLQDRPTPESDAARYTSRGGCEVVALDFARNRERQRDSLREALVAAEDCIRANRKHIEELGRHAVAGTSAVLDTIESTIAATKPTP